MKSFKKVLMMAGSLVLTAAIAIGGTVAYLQSEDSDVNVMTLGNVKIAQHEYERVVDENGNYTTGTFDSKTSYVLKDFSQAKPLLPIVGDPSLPGDNPGYAGYDDTIIRMTQVKSYGSMQVFAGKNAQDKFVTVENTGKSDAYVRTLVALELGDLAATDFDKIIGISSRSTTVAADFSQPWFKNTVGVVEIGGNNYVLVEFVYHGAKTSSGMKHENGILPAGDTTYPSLCQVYMHSAATNEDCEKVDGNKNGTYDVLVLSQAVQAAGFDNAKTALDAAFGEVKNNAASWFDNMTIPEVYEGVIYSTEGDKAIAESAGGTTVCRGVFSDGGTNATTVEIGEGIERLNNRALCKAPTVTSISLPNSLTYIDEGAMQQTAITSIVIPENVTYMGKTALGACAQLEKIEIKAKNIAFENYVARDCKALKEVYIYSDSVTFATGSMYFTTTQSGDASGVTFYVSNQAVADALFNSSSASRSYGMLIKSIDGATTYYNTLK